MAGSKVSRSPTRWSYEKEVGDVYVSVLIGASGAVSASNGGGVTSVTKLATAGQYAVQLQATYQRLLSASASVVHSTPTSVAMVQVLESGATVQAEFKADGNLVVQCLDFAGAAVNPPSGSRILLKVEVRQNPSTVFDK